MGSARQSSRFPPDLFEGGVLASWKEIATYFNTSVRTVTRWEQSEALPVHRHIHKKQGTVYAYKSELDEWLRRREAGVQREEFVELQAPVGGRFSVLRQRLRMFVLLGVGAITTAVIGDFLPRDIPSMEPLVAVPLTTFPSSEIFPSFSPSGNRIAFSWNGALEKNFDIYVKLIGPGDPLRITSDPADELSPAFSLDGEFIAFLRLLSKTRAEVVVVPSLGGSERILAEVHSPPHDYFFGPYVAWSPDGKWLVVTDKIPDGDAYGLFLVSTETGEKRQMTSPPATWSGDSGPAFSPDGKTLAFTRSVDLIVDGLYLLPLSDDLKPEGLPKQLTFDELTVTSPVWIADGREILFVSGLFPNRHLTRISAFPPGKPRQVGSVQMSANYIAVSPQGHRLAYAEEIRNSNIWRVELNGSSGKEIHPAPFISSTRNDLLPQFSPAGDKIAFISHRSGVRAIWVCDLDGLHARQLTPGLGPMSGGPRWSPRGKYIVFDSHVQGQHNIYSISIDGGKLRQLTDYPGENTIPSWSRNDQWIYFSSDRTGTYQVWKIPANGGEAVQITRKGGLAPVESPDGKYVYYAKALNRTSLWRTPLEGGEETKVLDSLVNFAAYVVTEQGVYFSPVPDLAEGQSIQFFQFASGTTRKIASIEKLMNLGLTVAPDERSLLYTQRDELGFDLMLVENFR